MDNELQSNSIQYKLYSNRQSFYSLKCCSIATAKHDSTESESKQFHTVAASECTSIGQRLEWNVNKVVGSTKQ